MTVSVSDPNRPDDLFQLETDLRYHYLQIYMKRATELGNPLVKSMNFVELGPKDFKIELRVESTDPPTLQLSFERIEKVLAQVHITPNTTSSSGQCTRNIRTSLK